MPPVGKPHQPEATSHEPAAPSPDLSALIARMDALERENAELRRLAEQPRVVAAEPIAIPQQQSVGPVEQLVELLQGKSTKQLIEESRAYISKLNEQFEATDRALATGERTWHVEMENEPQMKRTVGAVSEGEAILKYTRYFGIRSAGQKITATPVEELVA